MQSSKAKQKAEKKLAKFILGVSESLKLLAKEIETGGFDNDKMDLLSKIGIKLLFEARVWGFRF